MGPGFSGGRTGGASSAHGGSGDASTLVAGERHARSAMSETIERKTGVKDERTGGSSDTGRAPATRGGRPTP